MKKLTVSIDVRGTVSFLDKFPDDEEHAGLHEMLDNCHGEIDFDPKEKKPGLYLATMGIEHTPSDWTGDYDAYLDITDLEPIRLIPQEPTRAEIEEQERLKQEMMKIRQQAADSDKTITLGDELDSKDIYLENFIGPGKIRQVVGLHAVGYAGPYEYNLHHLDGTVEKRQRNFMALEVWGNEYDAIDGKMVGRGSFRIHQTDIDDEVSQWESEGWTRCEKPGKVSPNT